MVVPLALECEEICTGQIILQPISLKSDRLLDIPMRNSKKLVIPVKAGMTGVRGFEKLAYTFRTPSPYFATALSTVSSNNPSARACAIRMRSNGSLCKGGNSFTATVCSLLTGSSR